MKYYVNYDCGFDENDGDDLCEKGTLRNPLTHEDWIVDDTNKEDMRLLAIIDHYCTNKIGSEEHDDDDNGLVDEDKVLDTLNQDEFLKEIGCTSNEITKAVGAFNMSSYFPHVHSMCSKPHNYWFYLSISPVDRVEPCLNDNFLRKPWNKEPKD